MKKFFDWLIFNENEQWLQATIQANPHDQLAWLAYADWLEEQGNQSANLVRTLITSPDDYEAIEALNNVWDQADPRLQQLLQLAHPEQFNLIHQFNCSLSAAFEIHGLMNPGYHSGKSISQSLRRINQLIGGHGVESIDGNHWVHYWLDSVASYVNMGHTYDLTIIYDVVANQWLVTSYGDFIEEHPQYFAEDQDDDEDQEEEGQDDDEE